MMTPQVAPLPMGWRDWLECTAGNPVACSEAADDVTGAAKAVVGGAFKDMVKAFLESLVWVLEKLSTFWMRVPDPKVSASAAADSTYIGPIDHVLGSIAPWAAALAAMVMLIQCVLAVLKMSAEPFAGIGRQLLAIVVVQGSLAAMVQLALQASNEFSREILTLPGLSEQGLAGLVVVSSAMGSNALALWLILAILAILGSLMQLVFMMFRGPLIILLVIAVHVAAAVAGNDAGAQRLRRSSGLLVSFIIYKPVAAVIYATGFMLIYGVDGQAGLKTKDVAMNTLYGFVIVLLAALALPAVIKFVDPIAGSTGSSVFSGAVAAGAIAGGAAIATTGGAAAAGGGSQAGTIAKGGSSPPGAGTGTPEGSRPPSSDPGSGGSGRTADGSPPPGVAGAMKDDRRTNPPPTSSDDASTGEPGSSRTQAVSGQSAHEQGHARGGGPVQGSSGTRSVSGQSGYEQGYARSGGKTGTMPGSAAKTTGDSSTGSGGVTADGAEPPASSGTESAGRSRLPVWGRSVAGGVRAGTKTSQAADRALEAEGAER